MTKANSCRGHTTRVTIQNDDRDAATYRKRLTRGISDLDELCCPLCPKVEPRPSAALVSSTVAGSAQRDR